MNTRHLINPGWGNGPVYVHIHGKQHFFCVLIGQLKSGGAAFAVHPIEPDLQIQTAFLNCPFQGCYHLLLCRRRCRKPVCINIHRMPGFVRVSRFQQTGLQNHRALKIDRDAAVVNGFHNRIHEFFFCCQVHRISPPLNFHNMRWHPAPIGRTAFDIRGEQRCPQSCLRGHNSTC